LIDADGRCVRDGLRLDQHCADPAVSLRAPHWTYPEVQISRAFI
jgi:hypothetical protein